MGIRKYFESSNTPLNALEFVNKLGVKSVETLSQREVIPHGANVLGVGATAAALGKEVAFYRVDVGWTNVAPSYDEPVENKGFVDNIDFQLHDFDTLNDIFGEKQFDRIYGYTPDFADIANDRREAMMLSLVNLLNYGGEIHLALAEPDLINNANYNKVLKKLTYTKPRIIETRTGGIPQTRLSSGTNEQIINSVQPSISPLSPDSQPFFDALTAIGNNISLIGWFAKKSARNMLSRVFRRKNN